MITHYLDIGIINAYMENSLSSLSEQSSYPSFSSSEQGQLLPSAGLLIQQLQQRANLGDKDISDELNEVIRRQETLIAEVLGQQGELWKSMEMLEGDISGVKRHLRKHYGVNVRGLTGTRKN